MWSYILNRALSAIPTVIIIVILGFIIMELPAGDYLTYYLMELERQGTSGSVALIESMRQLYGLDKPAYQRFFIWLSRFVKGDFGQSFEHNKPVRELIGGRLALTFGISLLSLFIAWGIGIPVGVYTATHQYSLGDNVVTLLTFLGLGVPGFMVALVLLVTGMRFLGFVPIGLYSPEFVDAPWSWAKLVDLMKHIWVPSLVVAITGTAGLVRTMRGNLLDVLRLDYVVSARAKGLHESVVVWKHAVRNAIHPLVMSLGMSFPALVSGTAITGIVLNLPVIGPLYLQAVRKQDVYLAGTVLIMLTLMLVIGNLFADVLLAVVDPRIRYH